MGVSFFFRRGMPTAEIRAKQIGACLGAKLNPTDGYEEDLCICVKQSPERFARERGVLTTPVKALYYDVVDDWKAIPALQRRPAQPLIVTSETARRYLSQTHENTMVVIPQHHCNFDHERRPDRPMRVVGFVGRWFGDPPWYERMNHAIAQMGMQMRWTPSHSSRAEVVDAYRQMDIQFSWQPFLPEPLLYLKSPLKIINAASFGIPTVCTREPAFVDECDGGFIGLDSLDEALDAIRQLQTDETYYRRFADFGPAMAAPYFVTRIAEQYRELAWRH